MVSDDSSSDGLAALGHPADDATSPGGRQGQGQGRGQDRVRVPAKRNLTSKLSPSDLIFRAIARGGGCGAAAAGGGRFPDSAFGRRGEPARNGPIGHLGPAAPASRTLAGIKCSPTLRSFFLFGP